MVKPSNHGKLNVIALTSITTESNKMFAIPEELQHINFHKEVMATCVRYGKNRLNRRHLGKAWITLTKDLKKIS